MNFGTCGTCGDPLKHDSTKSCSACWAVENRLLDYLRSPASFAFVESALRMARERRNVSAVTNDDWTRGAKGSNSSRRFNELVGHVETIIRESAHALIDGRAEQVARLIMAQLAHTHGLRPTEKT